MRRYLFCPLYFFAGADPAGLFSQQAFFLERANSLSADLELDTLAVDFDSLVLQVWLPDLFGVALREADIASVLFAFAG